MPRSPGQRDLMARPGNRSGCTRGSSAAQHLDWPHCRPKAHALNVWVAISASAARAATGLAHAEHSAKAAAAQTSEIRADMYGKILGYCADCHLAGNIRRR